MAVMRSTSQVEVMAGVVADSADPERVQRVLAELRKQGFALLTVESGALAAALHAVARTDASPASPNGAHDVAAIRPGEMSRLASALLTALEEVDDRASTAGPAESSERRPFEAVIDAVTSPVVPTPAWFAQVRRNAEARQALLDEFGALSSEDVATLAGSKAANRRATAHRWQVEGKIFSVDHHGRALFPSFQFKPTTGRPEPIVSVALAALPAEMTGWALALWWSTPLDTAGWSRPVDLIAADPSLLAAAALAEAEEWRSASSAPSRPSRA